MARDFIGEAQDLFVDIDETDSVEVPMQLLEELRAGLLTDEQVAGSGTTYRAAHRAADNLLLWVDTH